MAFRIEEALFDPIRTGARSGFFGIPAFTICFQVSVK